MKNLSCRMSVIFRIWIVVSLLFSLIGVFNFWPNYVHDEFLLFTDFLMLLIFLPSFFILFFSLLTLLIIKLLNIKTGYKLVVGISLYCLTFLVLYYIFKDIWGIHFSIVAISLTSLVGLIHYGASSLIRNSMSKY